jgi:SAM-dependent methyltransferase
MSTVRTFLKDLLHRELFSLDPPSKQKLKYSLADADLRQAFTQHGHSLGPCPKIRAKTAYKWKLVDGKNSYLVKDRGDHLDVIQETHPLTCSVLEFVLHDGKPKLNLLNWRIKHMRQQREMARKKRQDHPNKLLVNLGAGIWYAPDWKVLEYEGEWYGWYVSSFIDYAHDLTSNKPFPFADNSVRLFYSEHAFEHFKDECSEHNFREAYRSLEPGGGFRIVVPDADLIYDRLLRKDESFFKSWMDRDNASLAESFCTLVGQARTPLDENEFARRLAALSKEQFLDSCKIGLEYDWHHAGEHINWFNYEKLERMLRAAGFERIRRCEAQQSEFPEATGPGFDTRAWYSVHVECVK